MNNLLYFVEAHKGRESAWMYLLAAFIGVFDARPDDVLWQPLKVEP